MSQVTNNNEVAQIQAQIKDIESFIKAEQTAISQVPEFLQKLVVPKKQAMVESLQKQVEKMQADVVKMEEKVKMEAEKEAKQAPYKQILAEIVSLKMSVEAKQKALAQAKGQFETNKNADSLAQYKKANEDFYAVKQELDVKLTESKMLKENLKAI